jgi:hypothetical protein
MMMMMNKTLQNHEMTQPGFSASNHHPTTPLLIAKPESKLAF